MSVRRSVVAAAAAIVWIAIAGFWAPAWSQSYPARPIRITVPLPPGGSNDLLARIIAERLQAAFGQPVIVENKPGGAGNIATEFVARQPADGYSLLFTSSAHAVNPSFFVKLPYDPIKDFEPIVLVGAGPFVLTVNASIITDPVIVREKLAPVGIEPLGSTPEKFADVIRVDIGRYAKIAKDARIKPE